jgi:hypothetical protein
MQHLSSLTCDVDKDEITTREVKKIPKEIAEKLGIVIPYKLPRAK